VQNRLTCVLIRAIKFLSIIANLGEGGAIMDRKDLVLAVLSTGKCNLFTPVQVQKLFFLIDRNIAKQINGVPFFNFEPYNYGPFDKDVYIILEELAEAGNVEMVQQGSWISYKSSTKGQSEGERIFSSIPQKEREYITKVSDIVRKLSFSQLVAAIYKSYPEMKENSVFQS